MNTEFQIKARLVRSFEEIQTKFVFVNDQNYRLVRKRLELERKKIVDMLVSMKEKGQILTLAKPKFVLTYSSRSKELIALIRAKSDIDKAISKIKEMFYK